MPDNKNSRRDFVKTATLGAAGVMLSAHDRVRVAVVGPGDRASDALIPSFLKLSEELNFELVAISDLWKLRRDAAAAKIKEKTGKDVAQARNNDELYAMKDIDAVIIATADFQHAYHCMEAVRAGRDVYVEKPFANTMADARDALKLVTGSDRIVQVGSQRRSTPSYMRANEFIRSGKFGDVVMVEMTWNVNQPGRWRRPQLLKEIRKEDTDWDRFLLNRREKGQKPDWDPRKYLEFRLFWPYSSGIPCQWMSHQIDTVHWFSGLPHPR